MSVVIESNSNVRFVPPRWSRSQKFHLVSRMDGRRPDILSRFISYLLAALTAEVYIGVQSLRTSSVDFVLVGESDFEFC